MARPAPIHCRRVGSSAQVLARAGSGLDSVTALVHSRAAQPNKIGASDVRRQVRQLFFAPESCRGRRAAARLSRADARRPGRQRRDRVTVGLRCRRRMPRTRLHRCVRPDFGRAARTVGGRHLGGEPRSDVDVGTGRPDHRRCRDSQPGRHRCPRRLRLGPRLGQRGNLGGRRRRQPGQDREPIGKPRTDRSRPRRDPDPARNGHP